ncbi:hypothetical protein V7O37_12055, partial [Escherichia coli]|uniref:hypothetical protein n=2 Tax=Escherichia coli TaxID=562 RepID=UPI00389D75D0
IFMLIRYLLVLSFLTFNVFADEIDFSTVDCNSVETRKALIEEYNEILSSYGITVVDSYNQKTIQKGINKLVCYGFYQYSDGSSAYVIYKAYPNSLGELISEFKPINE